MGQKRTLATPPPVAEPRADERVVAASMAVKRTSGVATAVAVSWGERVYVGALLIVWVTVAGVALAGGFEYYRTPILERAFSPLHDVYKPSGTLGHPFGIAGTAMMAVGVVTYSLRKRSVALAGVGKLRHWLQFHIFLCTLGPFLVLLHTSFKVGGIVSIAFWSMAVVVASGVFGRYLYARIPKTINGRFLNLRAIDAERTRLLATAAARAGVDVATLEGVLPPRAPSGRIGIVHALWLAATHDLMRGRRLAAVRHRMRGLGLPRSSREVLLTRLREEMDLEQQTRSLEPFQRLFSYWHLLHLPMAIVMLLIVIVHVAVAVLFGYGWLF